MYDYQADGLMIDTLGAPNPSRHLLMLKPISITKKQLKKIKVGTVLDGFEPYNLRIVDGDSVVARAKLGQIDGRDAIHIVSIETDILSTEVPDKSLLLEARLSMMTPQSYEKGAIIEFDELLSGRLLLLADKEPMAICEMVEHDDDVYVRIKRLLG